MTKNIRDKHANFIPWRFYLVLSLIFLTVAGISWRIFTLAILDRSFLTNQGDKRALRMVQTPALRGMIVDRNGFPLAISTTVYSIWINPQEFSAKKEHLTKLGSLLAINNKDILTLMQEQKKKKREFVYLKRGLSPEVAKQIKSLRIPGVYAHEEYRRYYPEGEVTAHLLGFTNVDDQGQEGLELAYNEWLTGESGKKWAVKDRLGSIISNVKTVAEQKPGKNLVLSIDRRLQYIAYKELLHAVVENRARSASAIVLDVKTGEVLAMVNHPSFNPNNRPIRVGENLRNRAVTDTFEPGSTIKAFSIASALDSGAYTATSVINTAPGWMKVGRNIVHDEKNNGMLSITQILQISSNMGVTKIILSLPTNQLWGLLRRLGFGEITGLGFPGEQSGVLIKPPGGFTLATLAFGYGLSVTAIQLARAYAVLANDGVKMPVSLLKLDEPPKGERVIEPHVTKQMLGLLESVLAKGATGELARVYGYRVAGKTGTVKMVGEGGYQKNHYESSFVGIAPLSNPRLVVAVIIHDPQGKNYYGGPVAGPAFQKIMGDSLRLLDITPDADG